MSGVSRRDVVWAGVATLAQAASPTFAQSSDDISTWMETWIAETRAVRGTLHLSRFVEPVYYLTKPTVWLPDAGQQGKYPSVTVPIGFVTDFASIPRLFWSALRPDGEYTHAAIVHDYLYWMQTTSRDTADEIFKLAMEDFKISQSVALPIYLAVRAGGAGPWESNAKSKAAGEKRILKVFPDDPTTKWADWKRQSSVFE